MAMFNSFKITGKTAAGGNFSKTINRVTTNIASDQSDCQIIANKLVKIFEPGTKLTEGAKITTQHWAVDATSN